MTIFIQLTCVLYRQLLICYPRDLRVKFGEEMVEVFGEMTADALAKRNLEKIPQLWATAFWELASVGLPQRLQSTTAIACGVSFLLSGVIAWGFFRAVG